ncbi:PREDICTED: MATH domain and coiled-coil domain-containing protein At3g58280-like [Camelina sativa]|uniref:MATH domain and coiled-coil domain-containing protein At3g58280-like n=1 Tax=Camelina sativa TaxID=90675 RepID=A0ABM0SL78_CAMSA|nr:PREDICTED: MATH domain and coiled-coil domain-containing protein At3g58280-like [Camelina sativa]
MSKIKAVKRLKIISKDDYLSTSEDSSSEDSLLEDSSSEDLLSEDSSSEGKETVKEEQVKEMFRKHPELTSKFNFENQQLKNAFMDVLLDLIKTLCKSTKELSLKDLNKAERTLIDLTRAGLKVGWLHQKWEEAYLKKEKQRISGVRIRELEEQVKKRKLTLSYLESDLKTEKAAALATKSRIGFSDVV